MSKRYPLRCDSVGQLVTPSLQAHLDDIDARLEVLEERDTQRFHTARQVFEHYGVEMPPEPLHEDPWDHDPVEAEKATSPSGTEPSGATLHTEDAGSRECEGLVERVAQAMGLEAQEARNAISEVADWLENDWDPEDPKQEWSAADALRAQIEE